MAIAPSSNRTVTFDDLSQLDLNKLRLVAVSLGIIGAGDALLNGIKIRPDVLADAILDAAPTITTLNAALARPVAKVMQQPAGTAFQPALDALDERLAVVASSVARIGSEVEARINASQQAGAAATAVSIGILKAQVEKAAKPVDLSAQVKAAVAAAFKPLEEKLVAAPEVVRQAIVAQATRVRKTVSEVFGIESTGLYVEVWGEPGDFDPGYVFDAHILAEAVIGLNAGGNLFAHGQRGTGKSEFVRNLAARLGRPFVRVNFHKRLEAADFLGDTTITGGTAHWQDGVILKAMQVAGCIILCDEICGGRAEHQLALHSSLEPRGTYTNPLGTVFKKAEGVCFFFADNSNGSGDETGRFSGLEPLNSAFIDRVTFFLEFAYLSAAKEAARLVALTGCAETLAKQVVMLLGVCRAEVGASVIEPPSFRAAIAFCEAVRNNVTPKRAWQISVVNKTPTMGQEALLQLFAAHWKD